MSRPSQGIAETARATFMYNCVNYIAVALLVYEYLITLGEEVEVVWRRKIRFSIATGLLASTRICMVMTAILAAAPPASTCTGEKVFSLFNGIINAVGYIQTALFSALRLSGLYGRNSALSIVVFFLGIIPVGTNIVVDVRKAYIQELGVCVGDYSMTDGLVRKLVLVSRIPVIVADTLVLLLTWAKTYQQALHSRFLTCLVRDGTIYFLALLTINILEIATHRTHRGALVTVVLVALPPILINRFMVNLRRTGNPMNTLDTRTQDPSPLSTLGFQLSEQTVNSMGEWLDHGDSTVPHEREDSGTF